MRAGRPGCLTGPTARRPARCSSRHATAATGPDSTARPQTVSRSPHAAHGGLEGLTVWVPHRSFHDAWGNAASRSRRSRTMPCSTAPLPRGERLAHQPHGRLPRPLRAHDHPRTDVVTVLEVGTGEALVIHAQSLDGHTGNHTEKAEPEGSRQYDPDLPCGHLVLLPRRPTARGA